MGIVLARAELARGLDVLGVCDTESVRRIFRDLKGERTTIVCDEDVRPVEEEMNVWVTCDGCSEYITKTQDEFPLPALWERAWSELLKDIAKPEGLAKAFSTLDTDNDGFIDSRETFGALAVLSSGHLQDRMTLAFEIFDLNHCGSLSSAEFHLLILQIPKGLRKMVGIASLPEKIARRMVQEVWKKARRQPEERITADDFHDWWMFDACVRGALKMFARRREHSKGLPPPDMWIDVDYLAGMQDAVDEGIVATMKGTRASTLINPRVSAMVGARGSMLTPQGASSRLSVSPQASGRLSVSPTRGNASPPVSVHLSPTAVR